MSTDEKYGGLTVETVGEAKPAPETHREIVAATQQPPPVHDQPALANPRRTTSHEAHRHPDRR